ncbi:RNA-binding protein [Trypanosoma cruzi]|nr:RNA-binding protein [Trypanosoma cruzi]
MGPTDVTLFSHFRMHLHAEAPQCRMRCSTEMCLLRVPRIRRVGGSVSRNHEEGSSPGIADKYSPLQITASISLTSSAGSVMGQLSIGRLAELHGYSPNTNRGNTGPTRSV